MKNSQTIIFTGQNIIIHTSLTLTIFSQPLHLKFWCVNYSVNLVFIFEMEYEQMGNNNLTPDLLIKGDLKINGVIIH